MSKEESNTGSISLSAIERERQIRTAAWYESADENPSGYDPMYKSFVQLMKYRRGVAERYLTCREDEKEDYGKLFDECNTRIKILLGL